MYLRSASIEKTALMVYSIEAVDIRKQKRISRVALFFCTRYGYTSLPCRFDVIGIDKDNEITHIKNAFDYV